MSVAPRRSDPADAGPGPASRTTLRAWLECRAAVERLHELTVGAGQDATPQDAAAAAEFDALLERVVQARADLRAAVQGARPGPARTSTGPLTGRQLEILRLVSDGVSTTQIATRLYLSRATVRNHVAATLRALGAHTRLEAVAIARRHGFL